MVKFNGLPTVQRSEPPEDQFKQERQSLIKWHTKDIAYQQKKIADLKEKGIDFDKFHLDIAKKGLVRCYFSLPYIKKYIEWNYTALADPVITVEDVLNIVKFLDFSIQTEAVDVFLYSACDSIIEEYEESYIDTPEKAEKELSDSDIDLFIFYLENVFKPSLLDIVKNMRAGKYRPCEEIDKEQALVLDKWVSCKGEASDELKKLNDKLLKEARKARTDFHDLLQQYSKACSFKDKLSESGNGEEDPLDKALNIADEITQKYAIHYPDMFKMGNSLLQNKMSLSMIPYTERDEARALTVPEKKGSADIFVSLSPDDGTVELSKPLDPFDIAVLDSVATLINSGNMAFTAPMVYRVMRGFDGGANLKDYDSPETIAHIEQSLENMRHIWTRIDYTEQAQKREKTKSKGKKYIVDGYLLQCTRAAVEINGKFVNSAYVATGQSPLHLYNMAIKQMLTIPSKLIDLKGAVNVNERAMLIARYLLRRIYTANYGQGYKISIETLCKEIGEPDATDKQIRSIKGTAEKLLIHWSTNESLKEISPLKGYSVYKIGKKVAGFNLNLREA